MPGTSYVHGERTPGSRDNYPVPYRALGGYSRKRFALGKCFLLMRMRNNSVSALVVSKMDLAVRHHCKASDKHSRTKIRSMAGNRKVDTTSYPLDDQKPLSWNHGQARFSRQLRDELLQLLVPSTDLRLCHAPLMYTS